MKFIHILANIVQSSYLTNKKGLMPKKINVPCEALNSPTQG